MPINLEAMGTLLAVTRLRQLLLLLLLQSVIEGVDGQAGIPSRFDAIPGLESPNYADVVYDMEFPSWPGGVVPYQFSPLYGPADIALYKSSMEYISNHSCVNFIPRTNETAYIDLVASYKEIGTDNPTFLYSGERSVMLMPPHTLPKRARSVLMLLLGFAPEHTRGDRDEYIRLNCSLCEKKFQDVLQKRFKYLVDLVFPYDGKSMTHIGTEEVKQIKAVMEAVDPTKTFFNEKQEYLSQIDLKKLNYFYNCSVPKTAAIRSTSPAIVAITQTTTTTSTTTTTTADITTTRGTTSTTTTTAAPITTTTTAAPTTTTTTAAPTTTTTTAAPTTSTTTAAAATAASTTTSTTAVTTAAAAVSSSTFRVTQAEESRTRNSSAEHGPISSTFITPVKTTPASFDGSISLASIEPVTTKDITNRPTIIVLGGNQVWNGQQYVDKNNKSLTLPNLNYPKKSYKMMIVAPYNYSGRLKGPITAILICSLLHCLLVIILK